MLQKKLPMFMVASSGLHDGYKSEAAQTAGRTPWGERSVNLKCTCLFGAESYCILHGHPPTHCNGSFAHAVTVHVTTHFPF